MEDPNVGVKDGELEPQVPTTPTEEPQGQEPTEPSPTPTPQTSPDEDHSEKSRLGRRVKRLEENIQSFIEELRASREQKPSSQDVPEIVSSPDDVIKVISDYEQKKEKQRQLYEGEYMKTVETFSEDPDLSEVQVKYEEVEKEMLANFNRKVTGNPKIDAELNWTKAKTAVIKKRATTPSQPRFNGRQDTPQGTPTLPTKGTSPTKPLPELSDYAKDFVKRTRMSEDSVRKALGTK